MDWTPKDIRYMCMNLFAIKNGKESDKLEDFRILEVKSNNIMHEMDRRFKLNGVVDEEVKKIFNERKHVWYNDKYNKEMQ